MQINKTFKLKGNQPTYFSNSGSCFRISRAFSLRDCFIWKAFRMHTCTPLPTLSVCIQDGDSIDACAACGGQSQLSARQGRPGALCTGPAESSDRGSITGV